MKKQLWNTEVIVKHLAEECVKCRQNIRSNAKSVQDFQKMANNQATFIKDLIIDFNFGFSSVKSEEKLKQIILVSWESRIIFNFEFVEFQSTDGGELTRAASR